MAFTIRRAQIDDAAFIAWAIVTAQRGHVPRGWFDIALDWPEPQRVAFIERIATDTGNRGGTFRNSSLPRSKESRRPHFAPCLRPGRVAPGDRRSRKWPKTRG